MVVVERLQRYFLTQILGLDEEGTVWLVRSQLENELSVTEQTGRPSSAADAPDQSRGHGSCSGSSIFSQPSLYDCGIACMGAYAVRRVAND
jgi:hypothetical protein